jgi:hypothetical protein
MNKLSNPVVEYPVGLLQVTEPLSRWIVVTPTMCQGDIPAYWDAHNNPVTYATKRDAWREVAETQIMKLVAFKKETYSRSGDPDEVPDFTPEDYVIPCDVHSDGVITTEDHGVLFDPRTDLSRYGR